MKRGASNHARYAASRIFLLHASNTGKLNLGLSETWGASWVLVLSGGASQVLRCPGSLQGTAGRSRKDGTDSTNRPIMRGLSKYLSGIGWPDGGSVKL
ncbi:hypothetical protein NQ317_013452 [Molorchus minor]|uniref:Uncharacterized protein n=1 Tax=Molorchus minor TaxID=1323400 RepID=A0ABQ9J5W4_9CUCU|nr:hypothetical protein NQ317_013452 [Molorchus minor]